MKLQFKEQDFQIEAVKAVVDCFEKQPLKTNNFTLERSKALIQKAKQTDMNPGILDFELEEVIGYRNSAIQITEDQMLSNIKKVQNRNNLHESQQLERPNGVKSGYNLTIEMETGTGKTYVYIRTMYELHKKYGWSKFIVVVPSIAIREGVYKSFQVTQDHFQECYKHKIKPFIYNSGCPQDIENFASDNRISVMIINTQAFNARSKDARRIHQELDQFGTRKPIDIIAQTQPILIIDEPQSVDGKKTLESMQDFKPLFTLRYSATHREDYNKIYRLDALDAYKKQLVKKVQVKGINLINSTGTTGYIYLENINLSTTKPPLAWIEHEKRSKSGDISKKRVKIAEGYNIYEQSGKMPAYKNQTVTEIDGYLNKITVGGQDIYPGNILNNHYDHTFRTVQIRECIQSHLQKEKQLFGRGIKVLSLFFIDAVEKYRIYDEFGAQQLGEYAQIFEEEYKEIRAKLRDTKLKGFDEYLMRDAPSEVHQGYFSIDKKGKTIDPKVKRGKEDSDDVSAYDLIMKDKERLLSFDEPTRFIFSHSALREGWDNPNVFQICALKHAGSGSTTRRRQEVGRGMRLSVDKFGVRQDLDLVGEQVHELNKLTVIASESYEAFAKGLQKEIADTLKNRPQKAEIEFFTGKVVTDAYGIKHRLSEEESKKLNKFLYKDDVIDENDKITPEGKELIERQQILLPESLESYRESICALLQTIYTETDLSPEDERQSVTFNTNHNFEREEFQALWNKINLKTIYEVQFDTDKLVQEGINKIDEHLYIGRSEYEHEDAYLVRSANIERTSVDQMKNADLPPVSESKMVSVENEKHSLAVYDVVGEIEAQTHLTRRTIVKILKQIKPEKFLLLHKNPEAFIAKCSNLINEAKSSLIINNIKYHKTEEKYDATTVFTNEKSALRQSENFKKHIYDCLTSDSKVESDFAANLDSSTEVVVYAKLPKSFYVATPIANYSPDWAIVFDKKQVRHIYFVAETKGSDKEEDLRAIEKLKIHCAEKHFKEISGGKVIFKMIASYCTLRKFLS